MSQDPFAGAPKRPVTLHKYLYANADPVSVVDPSGEFGITSISPTAILNVAVPLFTTQAGLTTVARFSLQFAFEYATGIPTSVNPKNLLSAVRSLKSVMSNLKGNWLDKFKAGSDFETTVKGVWTGLTKNTKCFSGGQVVPQKKGGCFIPDFLTKGGGWVEVKTSMGAVNKPQFQEFIKLSEKGGQPLTMVFQKKPTAPELETLQKWAMEASSGNTDDILLKIIHILD